MCSMLSGTSFHPFKISAELTPIPTFHNFYALGSFSLVHYAFKVFRNLLNSLLVFKFHSSRYIIQCDKWHASMQIVCKQYCYCCCCCTIWASLWMEHSKICLWFIWILDATIMRECGCFVYNAAAFINTIHSQILIGTFNSNPIWWPAQRMHTTQHSTRKRRSTNGIKPNKK